MGEGSAKDKMFWILAGNRLTSKISINKSLSKNNDSLFSQFGTIVLY